MKSVTTDRHNKRRRPGPPPLPSEALRRKRVAVHFTMAEYTEILRRAGGVSAMVPTYLRNAALNRLPPMVPEMNREAWMKLARMMTLLDRIAHHLNEKDRIETFRLRNVLARFRGALIGADLTRSFDEEHHERHEENSAGAGLSRSAELRTEKRPGVGHRRQSEWKEHR